MKTPTWRWWPTSTTVTSPRSGRGKTCGTTSTRKIPGSGRTGTRVKPSARSASGKGAMRMRSLHKSFLLPVCMMVLCAGAAHAFQFQASDSVSGNLDMQLTLGAGMRMVNQNPNLIGDTRVNPGANTFQSSNGDDGDLNYNQHDLFTTYLKFTPELLLKFPADFKFMARGTALYDFKATDTRRTDLEDDAEKQIARDVQLLDLWVSKDLNVPRDLFLGVILE